MKNTESLVCEDIKARAAKGREKYGTTVADNPLPLRQWLQHAYEEMLDQCVYLRRAMQEMDKKPEPVKWRMLKEGDVIEKGDEYFSKCNGWVRRTVTGRLFKSSYIPTRRRVTPDLSELSQHINELLKHE